MSPPKGTIIITGANGCLGRAFVDRLVKAPQADLYEGIYTVRDPSTAHDLQAILKSAPRTHRYEVSAVDLDTLENVRSFAKSVNSRVADGSLQPIRALILNAAGIFPGKPNFTTDGIEATFAVNYLANFLLVLLLLQSMNPEHGRIICIGSRAHDPAKDSWAFSKQQPRNFFTGVDSLALGEETFGEKDEWLLGYKRYGMSKALMNMFMYSLQRRLTADPEFTNLSVLSLDPGMVGGTTITKRGPLQVRISMAIISFLRSLSVYFWPNGPLRTPEKTAHDMFYVAFDNGTLGEHPKALYMDGTRISDTSQESRDEKKQEHLWEGSLRIAGVTEGDTTLQH